jgi:ribonuclease J
MKDKIKVIPLGGAAEIGKNMMVYEYDDKILIVDCGVSFPDEEHPGVDLIIPDFTYIRENRSKIVGLVLTHGHEDHVGAMGYFLTEFPEVKIYGGPLTLGIMGARIREAPVDPKTLKTQVVNAGESVEIGPFTVDFIRVSHSIPDAVGLAITTEVGTIIQSGDFKWDQSPIDGKPPMISRFAMHGEKGVLALLSDTTNATRAGTTESESTVRPVLERIFADAPGRIFVATFGSNVHRVQQVLDVAHLYGRKVAYTGRSMLTICGVATELGFLNPPEPVLDVEQIDEYPDDKICVVMTGSQGEPMAALSKIARGQNRFIALRDNDTVVLSSTPIPGNESAIYKVINNLCMAGTHVFRAPHDHVHVSGHGNRDDLKLLLNLTKPKFAIPYHGEPRHALAYADLCEELGYLRDNIPFMQVGDVVEIGPDSIDIVGTVPAGAVLVDGLTIGDVGYSVLRDRNHLGDDGVVVASLILDKKSGAILNGPNITQRGFLHQPNNADFLTKCEKLVEDRLRNTKGGISGDSNGVSRLIRDTLSDHFYAQLRRRPVILPVVMEY